MKILRGRKSRAAQPKYTVFDSICCCVETETTTLLTSLEVTLVVCFVLLIDPVKSRSVLMMF